MSVTTGQVTSTISEVSGIATSILDTLESVDPALALPVAIIDEISKLATAALAAFSAASGTPITVESVQALLPNPAPLTPPTE